MSSSLYIFLYMSVCNYTVKEMGIYSLYCYDITKSPGIGSSEGTLSSQQVLGVLYIYYIFMLYSLY